MSTIQTITHKVHRFYEHVSFPGYDDIDDADTLITKAKANLYVSLLTKQLPTTAKVIEIGCGTGQLTNLLALGDRQVVGADISHHSLSLAHKFKQQNLINTANFIQMDIFHPCFPKQVFDIAISNGVLHHTPNPQLAFKNMVALVKPKGLIILGLYNSYGRLLTNIRHQIYRNFGRIDALDYYLRQRNLPQSKKEIWFQDQYQNPHESQHTVDEILGWFKQEGIEYLNSVPKISLFSQLNRQERLFHHHRQGSRLEHLLSQLIWVITQEREGGLFILIGRKSDKD